MVLKSVVLEPTATGKLFEKQILRPLPSLTNQKVGGQSPEVCSNNPSRGPGGSLRTAVFHRDAWGSRSPQKGDEQRVREGGRKQPQQHNVSPKRRGQTLVGTLLSHYGTRGEVHSVTVKVLPEVQEVHTVGGH